MELKLMEKCLQQLKQKKNVSTNYLESSSSKRIVIEIVCDFSIHMRRKSNACSSIRVQYTFFAACGHRVLHKPMLSLVNRRVKNCVFIYHVPVILLWNREKTNWKKTNKLVNQVPRTLIQPTGSANSGPNRFHGSYIIFRIGVQIKRSLNK